MSEAIETNAADVDGKITCQICGAKVHSIHIHLRDGIHGETTVADYQKAYPEAPLLSELAKRKLAEKRSTEKVEMASAAVIPMRGKGIPEKVAMHDLFELGHSAAAKSASGKPIMITMVNGADDDLIPEIDSGYVYDMESLKNVLLGIEDNTPVYIWGHMGTGKSTLVEQVAARTRRPMIRVQHTVNTEESHIVGMWTVKDGATVFELGPLALAMKHGWLYMADEYDFALPNVTSVYQAVLEGKALVIKEADAANRVIKPNPNFRFLGTGNTNGSGDETGLYQGTNIQNAANYDRFGVVIQMNYMPKKQEMQVLINQSGLEKGDAERFVTFATMVREAFDGGKLSSTISPRTLITASRLGIKKGSWTAGLALSFSNKLSRIDREVVDGLMQRVFGE